MKNFEKLTNVVDSFSNELDKIDVLYAVNAKKESAVLNEPTLTEKPLRITDSFISVSGLLDYVNKYFPDVLPESALKHYGHNSRPSSKLGESILYSEKFPAASYEKVIKSLEKDNAALREDINDLKELVTDENKE